MKFILLRILIISFLIFFLMYCKKKTESITVDNDIKTVQIKKLAGIGIVNADRLRMRAYNDLHSKTLRYLDKGDMVRILKKDTERVRINEMEDYWYEIEFNGITGWIFGYFIDLYTDYDSAVSASARFKNTSELSANNGSVFEDPVYYNFFFLSKGELHQMTSGISSEPVKLKTGNGLEIINYYFTGKTGTVYYIASRSGEAGINSNLYSFDFMNKKNELLHKSVYTAYFEPDESTIIIAVVRKKILEEFWDIYFFDLTNSKELKKIISIKKGKEDEIQKEDFNSRTLKRERGTFCQLEWNESKNLIYFKPPEENQTYLISTTDGSFIKIDVEKTNTFYIDSSKYLEMSSRPDENGESVYSIVLKDRISGFEKEIVGSELYPINFCLSPRLNYIAITMADAKNLVENHYATSIYLLSLNTYSIQKITDGYQPKWSYSALR